MVAPTVSPNEGYSQRVNADRGRRTSSEYRSRSPITDHRSETGHTSGPQSNKQMTGCSGRRSGGLLRRKKEQTALEALPRRRPVHGSQKATGKCNRRTQSLLHSPVPFGRLAALQAQRVH